MTSRQDCSSVPVDRRIKRYKGARLVHLSTDVVFSGGLGRPLREDDPPDPVTGYGKAKAAAETAVAAVDPSAFVTS